jgi:hypothetical protein
VAADREHLQGLLTKLGAFDHGFAGWSDDDIRGHRGTASDHGGRTFLDAPMPEA